MSEFYEKIKNYYGLNEEECRELFREPSFSYLPTLEDEEEAIKAKQRILQAIKNKEKTLIYGDYDTDGIMSTSIIFKSIIKLGGSASIFIPSRYIDGYGLNKENATKIANAGYKLVILVDNGITAIDEVKILIDKKVDVIIIDHHETLDTLPNANAIIHPSTTKYKDYKYNVSAGYLSFMFSSFLLEEVDEYLLTLGGLSTFSDLMTLKLYNREIAKLTLQTLNKYKYKEFIYLTEKTYFDENVLNSEIIPCINAIGRIVEDHKGRLLVYYFASSTESEKQKYSSWMKKINTSRKELTKLAYEQVKVNPYENGICLISTYPEGINGLLANKLLNENNKVSIVFSSSKIDPSVYVGSIRSKKGCNCLNLFEKLSHYIIRSGGHELAGGISIAKENFEFFKSEFNDYLSNVSLYDEEKYKIPVTLFDFNKDSYETLRKFAPFGFGFQEPLFEIIDLPTNVLKYSRDEKHILTFLDNETRLFSFNIGKADLINKNKETFDVKYSLNEYRSKFNIDILLSK